MGRQGVLEILLDRVQLEETAGRPGRIAQHLLLVTLVWPRARVSECVAVKPVLLEQKNADLRKSTWTERILFKELVEGPFGLRVGITKRTSGKEISPFLRYVGSRLCSVAGKEIEDLILTPVLGPLARIPFRYGTKYLSLKPQKKEPPLIAEAGIDLSVDQLKEKKGKASPIHIPLVAPVAIYRPIQRKPKKGGKAAATRRILLKEGDKNGSVDMTASLL